jgi:5-methylcytosine-specific restriction endonuclease McrA
MPSSPNYVRDIPQEKRTAKRRGDIARDNARKRARRLMLKKGLVKPGQDVDHKVPLIRGGSATALSNLRAASPSANRSFRRTKNAGMKTP